jgi:beta-lactam-binding protein with PASTA domain
VPVDVPAAFFSYSREDSEFTLRLAGDLKSAGANVWLDQLDIAPGQRWDRSVEDALTNCPRLLVVLSPSSINSTNVLDEVSFALENQKTVVPVLYRDCAIPFRLRRIQYLDFRADYAHALKGLLKTLGVGQPPEQSVAAPSAAPTVAEPEVPYVERERAAEEVALEDQVRSFVEEAKAEPPRQTGSGTTVQTPPERERGKSKVEPPLPPPPPWKLWLTLACAAIGVVVVGILIYRVLQVTVPNVVGTSLSDAAAKVEAAHLSVGRKTYQQAAENGPDIVLSQSPAPNTRARRGSAVDLLLSQAEQQAVVEVPDLVGKLQQDAEQALRERRLALGSISTQPKADIARNTILDQFPKAGKKVDQGAAIDLVVSETPVTPGPELVKVPRIVGKLLDQARSQLQQYGLSVGRITKQPRADVAANTVLSQSINSGQQVQRASRVDLVVSETPPPPPRVQVPNLVGLSLEQARTQLQNQGLSAGNINQQAKAGVATNTVLSQSPSADQQVQRGSQVNVTVSQVPPPSTIAAPNLVGLSLEQARTQLQNQGLAVGNITQQARGGVAENTVLSQSLSAGQQIQRGSRIHLTVAAAPRPSVTAQDLLAGSWVNVDRQTRKNTSLMIEWRNNQWRVFAWAYSGDPNRPVLWGEAQGTLSGDQLTAQWNMDTLLTMRIHREGDHLIVTVNGEPTQTFVKNP